MMFGERTIDIWRTANGQDYRLYTLTIRKGNAIQDLTVEISDEVFQAEFKLSDLQEAVQKYYNFKDIEVIGLAPIKQIWRYQ